MARLKEMPDVTAEQMRRHNLNWGAGSAEAIARLNERGIQHSGASGFYSEAQIKRSEYLAKEAKAPAGLYGGILSHVDDPAGEAKYPGYSKWPNFYHPPTPPPWGWQGHDPIWNWEIGWEFPAGFQMDWHYANPPAGWVPAGSEGSNEPPSEPAAGTLPGVPSMEGDPMIIVLPRWQQGLGRYLTDSQERYDHGVTPIKAVDSWAFGKLNYRIGNRVIMGRIS